MSFLVQAYLLDRYGLRLNAEQIAEVLAITKPALYNQISAGTCPVKNYLDQGKRFADFRDMAEYLDECRTRAK